MRQPDIFPFVEGIRLIFIANVHVFSLILAAKAWLLPLLVAIYKKTWR
jgi:hypothetical protein